MPVAVLMGIDDNSVNDNVLNYPKQMKGIEGIRGVVIRLDLVGGMDCNQKKENACKKTTLHH